MPLDPAELDMISDTPNPLDAVETVLATYNLDYIRMDDDELVLSVAGTCASYRLFLTWQNEFEALQIICQFPSTLALPDDSALARLLFTTNMQLWLGHFELGEERTIQFRYTTLLHSGVPGCGVDYMNDLFKLAVAECDRFFPALNLICDNVMTDDAVLAFAMQDTAGEG